MNAFVILFNFIYYHFNPIIFSFGDVVFVKDLLYFYSETLLALESHDSNEGVKSEAQMDGVSAFQRHGPAALNARC